MFTYNDPKLKSRRKELRRNETKEEKLLWENLRRKKLGVKFNRQYSVGPYVLDFYCVEKRLGLELDGAHHLKDKDYDKYSRILATEAHIALREIDELNLIEYFLKK